MNDLRSVLELAPVVLLHDMYNPACREGALDVLRETDCYFDLDLVPGRLQEDGPWGGFGIVLKNLARSGSVYMPAILNEQVSDQRRLNGLMNVVKTAMTFLMGPEGRGR
jgi:hypothetical protein